MIEYFAPDDSILNCDVCIVGSGPVGLSMALQFADTDVSVIVVESGGNDYEPESAELSEFENAGCARSEVNAVRRRIFGGTSTIWSGRCMPFSSLDLVRRNWLPSEGWPVTEEEMLPWLEQASKILGAGPLVTGQRLWHLLGMKPDVPWDPACFEPQIFLASSVNPPRSRIVQPTGFEAPKELAALQHSGMPAATDLGEASREALQRAGNVRVLLRAHALEIDANEDCVTGVTVASPDGQKRHIRAQNVVAACGGIDNARLLLLSKRPDGTSLGNRSDQVGRYLADHHYAPIAHLDEKSAAALRSRLRQKWFDFDGTRYIYAVGASLSAQRQREEKLPRATLYSFEHRRRDTAITSARKLLHSFAGSGAGFDAANLKNALFHPYELSQCIVDRYVFKRPSLDPVFKVDVGCNVEQIPNPDSRLILGEKTDKFGQKVARVDWRMDDREFHGYQRTAELFAQECRRLGLGDIQPSGWIADKRVDWREELHDMAHPMCSTRMASSPEQGVVDRNCEVFGVRGLYMAGSSVFSTGGTSNPTLMAVALGLRVAHRIKKTLLDARRATEVRQGTPSVRQAPDEPRIRVAVIGAGHRVQNIFAPVLAALAPQVEVCGFHARSEVSRALLHSQTGWTGHSSLASLFEQGADAYIVVVSPEANHDILTQLFELGRPILVETPLAWNLKRAKALCAVAARKRVPLGVSEQFPFLPAERLKHKLINIGAIGAVRAAVNDFATYDYHGIAQLRSYLGADAVARRARAWKHNFGHTGQMPGMSPVSPEHGWEEDWLSGMVELEGGSLLVHSFSAGFATLPSRPGGEMKVFGDCGSIVGERLLYADRTENLKGSSGFTRGPDSVSVEHPVFGTVEWRSDPLTAGLPDQLQAVAAHVSSLARVVRYRSAPLYLASEACQDMELLQGLQYSARSGGASIGFPLGSFSPKAQVVLHRAMSAVGLR